MSGTQPVVSQKPSVVVSQTFTPQEAALLDLPHLPEQLTTIKSLGIFFGRSTFYAAKSKDRLECILREPGFVALCLENVKDMSDLKFTHFTPQGNKAVRYTQITIVFWNLVFQNHVIAPSIPSKIRYGSMVLMAVVAIVSENKVRRHLFLQFFKILLDLRAFERKEAIAKFLNNDLLLAGPL